MAHYDKYEPYAGGFRALLKADFTDSAKFGVPFGVSLDADGLVVFGNGNSFVQGVLVLNGKKKAGAVVDVMTTGEITDFGGVAGTDYFAAAADGVINATSAAGKTAIGFTAEADRLIVRVKGQVPA